jgi:hypothetical protein
MKLFWQTVVWGALAGLVIGSGALFKAHADPDAVPYAVCAELGTHPNIFTVSRVLEEIEASGLTVKQAASVVVESVTSTCPQYVPLLQRFIDTYSTQAVAAV